MAHFVAPNSRRICGLPAQPSNSFAKIDQAEIAFAGKELNFRMHYLLFYELADDYMARRGEFRAAHLEMAWQASERGELVLAGALADPVDSAVLLFQGDSAEAAEKFARADPYVTNGIVRGWRVRQWTTVAGEGCAMPTRPAGALPAS